MKLQIVKKLLLVLIGTFFIIGSVEAEAIGLEQSRKELRVSPTICVNPISSHRYII